MNSLSKLTLTLVIGTAVLLAGYGLRAAFFTVSRPNVIVILIDTLRADHLGIFGYERNTSPTIDGFAKESTLFTFCNAAAPWTPSSVASLFTSVYPSAHGLMPPNDREQARAIASRLPDQSVTLAEALQSGGYATGAIISNPWLKIGFGFEQGFERFEYHHRVRADQVNAAAFKMLNDLKSERRPFFLYLHYMDPHNPFDPPPEYRSLFSGPLQVRNYPKRQQEYINLYDGEIRYTDDQIAELFRFLKQQRLYDQTVILLLSDHGEQFMERGRQGHGYHLFNEELRVPRILKHAAAPAVIEQPISLVDFYPTLLELAKVPAARPLQGYSLLSALSQRAAQPLLAEVRRNYNFKAVISPAGEKIIYEYPMEQSLLLEEQSRPVKSAIYDSQRVVIEEAPLNNPQKRMQLEQDFERLYGATRKLGQGTSLTQIEIDPSTVEELKTLGYL